MCRNPGYPGYPGFILSKNPDRNPGNPPGYRDKRLNVNNIYRKLSCNTFKSFENHDNMFAVHFSIFSGTFWKYHMQCFINTYWYSLVPGFTRVKPGLPGFQSGFLNNMKPG